MKIKLGVYLIILATLCLSLSCSGLMEQSNLFQNKELSFLVAKGTDFVDEDGNPVILRGANLGSWLNLEMWMMDVKDNTIEDQYTFEEILEERFGADEKDRIMDLHRENWITARDFKILKSFGFNCVRVPFHYNIIEDDDNPMTLRPDAWKWLDRAIELAENHGMYVVLDLHSVAGCQNDFDHSGRINWNKFWEDKVYWERTAWLWKQVAQRYKDNPTVAVYQPINEPWGGSLDEQREVFDYLYKAIREFDDKHVIIASSHYTGFDHFGDPKEHGWVGVGFSNNFYPGLFGGSAAMPESHRGFFGFLADYLSKRIKELDIPFLVSEFNVVFNKAGGAKMMHHHYEEYAKYGWATTMWSYKLITSPGKKNTGGWWLITNIDDEIIGGWWLVTNKDPLPPINIRTASLEEIESYFKSFSTFEYRIHEELRDSLVSKEKLPPLQPAVWPEPIKELPFNEEFKGWTGTDIGGAKPGGQKVHSDTKVDMYGSGLDIWGPKDQFRYLWKKVDGDFSIEVTIDSLINTSRYAKSGMMIRKTLDADSPCRTIYIIPDGSVEFGWRLAAGEDMANKVLMGPELPGIRLKLVRKGNMIERYFAREKGAWAKFDEIEFPDLGQSAYVGLLCLSQNNEIFTKTELRDIKLTAIEAPE